MPKVERLASWMDRWESWLGLAFLCLAVLLVAGFGYDLGANPTHLTIDLAGLAVGGLLLAYVLGRPAPAQPATTPVGAPSRRLWRAGLAGIALGTLAGALAVDILWRNNADWQLALPWWLVGLMLATAGALAVDRGAGRGPGWVAAPTAEPRAWRPNWTVIALAAIFALATVLRVYRLGDIPPGIFIDETDGALDSLAILHGAPTSPFGTGWYEIPSGYMYLMAGYIGLLGPTLAGLKASGVVNGLLAVAGVFFLGRLLFGTRAGLTAAFFMAVARWPLNMSRWGWVETGPPVAQVWAVYFLIRGTRTHRASDFAIGGLILGLGMYSYLSIRLVLVAIAAYLLYRIVVERDFLRLNLSGLALFALLWALTFAPLAVTYIQHPNTFMNRSSEVTIQKDIDRAGGSLAPVLENVQKHLLMFNGPGDRNPRHNAPGLPMLDPIMGALFVVAIVRALSRLRDHRFGLLLIWIPAILLGGILSVSGPHGFRTLGVTPAVAILCGEALVTICGRFADFVRRLGGSRRLAAGVPVALGTLALAGCAWLNASVYFGAFANDPNVYSAFSPLETEVARDVASAPDPSTYYLEPDLYYVSPVRYFSAGSPRVDPAHPQSPPYRLLQSVDDLPLRLGSAPVDPDEPAPAEAPTATGTPRDLTVLWGPKWFGLVATLRQLYPHLTLEAVPARSGGTLYERVVIPARDVAESQGLMLACLSANGVRSSTRVADPTSAGDLPCPAGSTPAEWSGSLHIAKSGSYTLGAPNAEVLIDGKPADKPVYLANGIHELKATPTDPAGAGALKLALGDGGSTPGRLVSAASLFAVTPATDHGLLGSYYRGERWEGQPVFSRVDPLILFGWPESDPFPGAFSVSWRGQIEIAAAGSYGFYCESDDGARLWIDGRPVAESLKPDSANYFEARVDLTPGRHAVRLDYFQRGGAKVVTFRWAPPGKQQSIVPTDVLYPAAP